MNDSGIIPIEFKVLVLPAPVEEKKGSIIIPDATRDAEKFAATQGRIVAMSHMAFSYASPEEWGGSKPKAGDMVIHAKYAGLRIKGKDGKEYVMINDKDVVATIEE